MRARLIGGLPSDLVGSLNGLTQGHFPVFAKARYADDLAERATIRRAAATGNVAPPVDPDATRRGIDIFAAAGARAIAVQDGRSAPSADEALGNYVRLRDAFGNTYTYPHLKTIAAGARAQAPDAEPGLDRTRARPAAPRPAPDARRDRRTPTKTSALTAPATTTTTTPLGPAAEDG